MHSISDALRRTTTPRAGDAGARRVEEIMSSPVLQVSPDTPLEHIARMFLEYGISAVPVVDAEDELLGIVTKTDLGRAEAFDRYLPDLLYREGSNAVVWDLEDGFDAEGLVAADVMSTEVEAVSTKASPREAAVRMTRERIHHLLVTENDKVVGMLSSLDLVAWIAGDEQEPGGSTHVERSRRRPTGRRSRRRAA